MNTKRNVVMAEAAINGVSLADAARRARIEYPRLQRVLKGRAQDHGEIRAVTKGRTT